MADRFIRASDLARLGYCEREVAFDAQFGPATTGEQELARKRGDRAHAAFHAESRRVVDASRTKGKCFIATLALGSCEETRALRAYRDLVLRRSWLGRWLIGRYYRISPQLCRWLSRKPRLTRLVGAVISMLAKGAGASVRRRLRRGS